MAGLGRVIDVPKPLVRKLITFSGTVEVESSPAARVVQLFNEQTGELVGSVLSNSSTGVWSITISGTINVKHSAVCLALSGSRNSKVVSHVTGIE